MLVKWSFPFAQLLLLITVLVSFSAVSQIEYESQKLGSGNARGLYLQTKGGFLLAHRSAMAHLVQNNTYGFELGFIKHFQSDNKARNYRHPAIGANIEFRNFGYDAVLGKAISASYFFNAPIYQTQSFFIDFQYGTGIGYLTRKYDLESNLKNNAIGSHINAKVSLKLLFTKYLKQTSIGLGLEMAHFSNGAFTFPNLGLNLPSVFMQIGFLDQQRMPFKKDQSKISEVDETKRVHQFLVAAIFSAKQVRANPNLPKRYPIFGLRGTYQHAFSKNWSWEGSIELIHNESNLFFFGNSDFKRSDVLQIGLYAGANYQFFRSEVLMGIGYYLRNNINTIGGLYNKIGYRYFLNSKWFGLFNVRANLGRADFFEFGIGYRIR